MERGRFRKLRQRLRLKYEQLLISLQNLSLQSSHNHGLVGDLARYGLSQPWLATAPVPNANGDIIYREKGLAMLREHLVFCFRDTRHAILHNQHKPIRKRFGEKWHDMFGTGKNLKQLEIEQAKMQIWMTCTMAIWNFMTELLLSFRLVNDFVKRTDFDAGDDESIEALTAAFLTFKLDILPFTTHQTAPTLQLNVIEPWIHLRELVRSQFVLVLNAYAAYTYRLEYAHRLKLYYRLNPHLAPRSSSSSSASSISSINSLNYEPSKEPSHDPSLPPKRNWRFCPAATIMQAILIGTAHIIPTNEPGNGGPDDDSDLESLDTSSNLTFWDVQNILGPWSVDHKSCSHSSTPTSPPSSPQLHRRSSSSSTLPDLIHHPTSSSSSLEDENIKPSASIGSDDRFITCVFCSQLVDLYCTSDEKQDGKVYSGVKTRYYRLDKGEVRDESWIREIYGACHVMFATGGNAEDGWTFFGDSVNGGGMVEEVAGNGMSVAEEVRCEDKEEKNLMEKMIRENRRTYRMGNLLIDPCEKLKKAKFVCSVCFSEGRSDGEVVRDKEGLECHLKEVHGS